MSREILDYREFWQRKPLWIRRAEHRDRKIWHNAKITWQSGRYHGNYEAMRVLDMLSGSEDAPPLTRFTGERPIDLHEYGRGPALAACAVMTEAARDASGMPTHTCNLAKQQGPPHLPVLTHILPKKETLEILGCRLRHSRTKALYVFIGTPRQIQVARVAGFYWDYLPGLFTTADPGTAAALAAFADPETKKRLLQAGLPATLVPYMRYAPALIPMKQEFRLAVARYAEDTKTGVFRLVPAPDGRNPKQWDGIPYWKKRRTQAHADSWQDAPGGGFTTRELRLAEKIMEYAPRPLSEKLRLYRKNGIAILEDLIPRETRLEGKNLFANQPGGGSAKPADLYDACHRCSRLILTAAATASLELPEEDKGDPCPRRIGGKPCSKAFLAGQRLGKKRMPRATAHAIRVEAMQRAKAEFSKSQHDREEREREAEKRLEGGEALPPGFSPTEKQIPAIVWCYARPVSLLAEPMGAGKTIIAIALWNLLKREGATQPALVICPALTRSNWQSEAGRFLREGNGPVFVLDGKNRPPDHGFQIASYESVRDNARIRSQHYALAVLDESHFIKNTQALRTKAAFEIQAEHWCMMTGTPIYNRPPDLYPVLDKAFPGIFGTARAFRKAFDTKPVQTGDGKVLTSMDRQKLKETGKFLRDTIMIKHEFREIVSDIPEMPAPRLLRVPIQDAKQIAKEENELIERIANEGKSAPVLALLQKLRLLVGERKVHHVVDHIKTLQEPFLAFCQHKRVAKAIQTELGKKNILAGLVTGDVSFRERDRIRHAFDQKRLHGICATMAAMGVGLNLVRAKHVVFAEIDYNPAQHSQAEARAIRKGQTGIVQTWYIAADGTLDATIGQTLAVKRELADELLTPEQELDLQL